MKLDATGTIQWQKSLGGTGDDLAYSAKQTTDGGYIVAGYSSSNDGDVSGNHGGFADYWVVKLDALGNLLWEKSLGGTRDDLAYSILQTADGGYVVAGTSNSNDGDVTGNHGGLDYWVVKLNSSGNLIWQKSMGGTFGEGANSIQKTADGGYIVAGFSLSKNGNVTGNHGGYDYWLVKLAPDVLPVTLLNFDGILQNNTALLAWSTATEINNKGFEVQKSLDGHSFSNIGFVPGAGSSSTLHTYNFSDTKLLSGSNYYRLNQIDFDGKSSYSSIIKFEFSKFDWTVLGNPSSNKSWVQLQLDKTCNVTIQIMSLNGDVTQTINKGKIGAGTYSIPLNLSNKASGIYIVKLQVDQQTFSKKFLK